MPTCPHTLDDPAPELTREMLQVPTSELYSAALEAAWQELDNDGAQGQRPTPDRVAQLEPNPKEYSSPRPRHYGPYAVERASLDWSYHVVPNRARQALQDEIVSLVLEKRLRDCRDAGDDEPCRVFEAREGFRDGETTVSRVDDEDMGRKGEGRPGDKGRPLALFTAGCVSVFSGEAFPEERSRNLLRQRNGRRKGPYSPSHAQERHGPITQQHRLVSSVLPLILFRAPKSLKT